MSEDKNLHFKLFKTFYSWPTISHPISNYSAHLSATAIYTREIQQESTFTQVGVHFLRTCSNVENNFKVEKRGKCQCLLSSKYDELLKCLSLKYIRSTVRETSAIFNSAILQRLEKVLFWQQFWKFEGEISLKFKVDVVRHWEVPRNLWVSESMILSTFI